MKARKPTSSLSRGHLSLVHPLDEEGPEFDALKDKALKLLKVQARTRDELAGRLMASGGHSRLVEAVLDRLEDLGLVDDKAFTRDYVSVRLRKGQAMEKIRRDLLAKGVSANDIEDVLAESATEDPVGDELERATELACKKARTLTRFDRNTAYRRLSGFLFQRGFDAETVKQATLRAVEEAGID